MNTKDLASKVFKSCSARHIYAILTVVFLCGGTFALLQERQTVQAATMIKMAESCEEKGEKIVQCEKDIIGLQGDVTSTKETVEKMWLFMNPTAKE